MPPNRDLVLERQQARHERWRLKPAQVEDPHPTPERSSQAGEQENQDSTGQWQRVERRPKRVFQPRPQRRRGLQAHNRRRPSPSRHQASAQRPQSRALRFTADLTRRHEDKWPRKPLILSEIASDSEKYQEALAAAKKYYTIWLGPDVRLPFVARYIWPWGGDPIMEPARTLGPHLEALDDIKLQQQVFMNVERCQAIQEHEADDEEPEEPGYIIKIMGERGELVETALSRVKGAGEELMSKNSEISRVLLVDPQPTNVTGVQMREQSSTVGEPVPPHTCGPYGTTATPLVDLDQCEVIMTQNVEPLRQQRLDNIKMRTSALAHGLVDIHALRKLPRLTISIGTLQMLQFTTPKQGDTYDLIEFYDMTQHEKTKFRIAPDSFTDAEIAAFQQRRGFTHQRSTKRFRIHIVFMFKKNLYTYERQYPKILGDPDFNDQWFVKVNIALDCATLFLDKNIAIETKLSACEVITDVDGRVPLTLRQCVDSIKIIRRDPPTAVIDNNHGADIRWSIQTAITPFSVVYTGPVKDPSFSVRQSQSATSGVAGTDDLRVDICHNAAINVIHYYAPPPDSKYSSQSAASTVRRTSGQTTLVSPTVAPQTKAETAKSSRSWIVEVNHPNWTNLFANQDALEVGLKPNWSPTLKQMFPGGVDDFYAQVEAIRQDLVQAVTECETVSVPLADDRPGRVISNGTAVAESAIVDGAAQLSISQRRQTRSGSSTTVASIAPTVRLPGKTKEIRFHDFDGDDGGEFE